MYFLYQVSPVSSSLGSDNSPVINKSQTVLVPATRRTVNCDHLCAGLYCWIGCNSCASHLEWTARPLTLSPSLRTQYHKLSEEVTKTVFLGEAAPWLSTRGIYSKQLKAAIVNEDSDWFYNSIQYRIVPSILPPPPPYHKNKVVYHFFLAYSGPSILRSPMGPNQVA